MSEFSEKSLHNKVKWNWIIISLLLVIILVLGGMLLYFWHQKDYNQETVGDTASVILINETNFPDPLFRKYVQENFDMDRDGILSQSEADAVTRIEVNKDKDTPDSEKISSLKGIEYFSELKDLDCRWNQLTRLDLSKNAKLRWLDCQDNQLTRLDLSKNAKLRYLNCGGNQLTNLDLSENTELEYLWCYDNQLTTLDVSKNTELEILWCYDNQLTTLDVSKNTKLDSLVCDDDVAVTGYNN